MIWRLDRGRKWTGYLLEKADPRQRRLNTNERLMSDLFFNESQLSLDEAMSATGDPSKRYQPTNDQGGKKWH